MEKGFLKENVGVSNKSPSLHLGHLNFRILYSLVPFFGKLMWWKIINEAWRRQKRDTARIALCKVIRCSKTGGTPIPASGQIYTIAGNLYASYCRICSKGFQGKLEGIFRRLDVF
jgi:hypothetical protein